MYENLIAALRACVDKDKDCSDCTYYSKCMNNHTGKSVVMVDAADAIEELSQRVELEHQSGFADGQIAANRKKPRWIPVTERLPEKRKWVLCWCVSKTQEVLRWENNEWYHDPQHVYFSDFVTHWMPPPEPPKEEVEA